MYGVACGLAYIYMAATWGGYVFVLNMIGVHTGVLVLLGRYTPSLHMAYSLFYFIGTIGAIQVPVIAYTPLKSLEQLPCLAVFGGLQLLEFARRVAAKKNMSTYEHNMFRFKVRSSSHAKGILFNKYTARRKAGCVLPCGVLKSKRRHPHVI